MLNGVKTVDWSVVRILIGNNFDNHLSQKRVKNVIRISFSLAFKPKCKKKKITDRKLNTFETKQAT